MDYLITEAVAIKVNREDAKDREDAEKEAEMKRRKQEAIGQLKQMFPSTGR